jgi:hypothetical protein
MLFIYSGKFNESILGLKLSHDNVFSVADTEGKLLLKKRFPVKHKELAVHSTFCPIMSFRQGACIGKAEIANLNALFVADFLF